jgi:hypothetical protein
MSSESVCQVARSWVDVGSFHTRLMVSFMMILTVSVRNILDTPSQTDGRTPVKSDITIFFKGKTSISGPGPSHYRGFTPTLEDLSGRVISPMQRPLLHNTQDSDIRLNPQSQQASGCRLTPYIARQPGIG